MRFRTYSTDETVLLLVCCDVKMTNKNGRSIKTRLYVKLADKHKAGFQGIGWAKVEPIHIHIKDDATPIARGKRPIPMQFKAPVKKKLEYMKENGLV